MRSTTVGGVGIGSARGLAMSLLASAGLVGERDDGVEFDEHW